MRLLSFIFISFMCLFSGCSKNDETLGDALNAKTLTLLHTNDLHSHFLPTDHAYQNCEKSIETCLGGYGRIKSIVDTVRSENDNVIFLDAGDRFSGTIFYTMRKSQDLTELTQRLEYDAMTLGNHEFDDGIGELKKFTQGISAPIVSANVSFPPQEELKNRIKPSVILERNGLKIGIIGALSEDTIRESAQANQINITPVIPAVQAEVKKMTEQGVTVLIALTHIGIDADKKLAEAVPQLDIIVGAHTHTLLSNDKSIPEVHGDYPMVIEHDNQTKTLIVTVGQAGRYIGLLKTSFDKNGKIISYRGDAIAVDKKFTMDDKIANKIKDIQNQISILTDKILMTSPNVISMTKNQNYCSEACYVGEVLTDALWSAFGRENADVVLLNSGGIRTSLPLNITLGRLANAYPFDSTAVLVHMSGKQLKNYIEQGLRKYRSDERVNAFLQIGGGSYNFSEKTKTISELKISGQPIQYDKIYRVILPSFLANGGDGFSKQKKSFETNLMIREMISTYWQNSSYQIVPFEKRIQKQP